MTDRIAPPAIEREWEAAALSELVACETVAQTCAWIARWAVRVAGAGGALVWVPHSTNAAFLCVAATGEGTERFLRRPAPREEGIVHQLLRDRKAAAFERSQIGSSSDPWLAGLPPSIKQCVAVPLERERGVVGLLSLLFQERTDLTETLVRIERLLPHAASALARAARADKKHLGMLHAIERLTNLYDLGKAFSSTIETAELSPIIARKAVDLLNAEAASLWMLEHDAGEVVLAATAVNERFAAEAAEAVGAEIVADVIADRGLIARQSLIAVPLLEEESPIGALIVAHKHGRHPEFTAADEELLTDLARQAVRALHNARLYGAEQRVEELDALLAVSREITSTLDLDRVLKTIVNASSALISYERCAIAVMQRGSLRVGAVSGMLEVNRRSPEVRRLEELLQWVYFSGAEIAVTCDEEGEVVSDRAETAEKFRVHFHETGMRSFFATLLQDEEGKLGVLSFESKEPLLFDQETRDLLQILRNQATVAVRNAQLYQQVPLAGFLKPLMDRKTRIEALPQSRRRMWVLGAAAVLLLLVAVPWPLRLEGPARVLPGRRIAVTAPVDGVIDAVMRREGDRLRPGDVIARLRDDGYQAALAAARSDLRIAESDLARSRLAGDSAAVFAAQARRDALRARIDVAREQLARTEIRAAAAGLLLTPNLEERVGQFLSSGSELAVIGDISDVEVDVAVPEADASLLRTGERVALKIRPYPTRTWHGVVTRVGASVHEEGKERFVIVESRVPNPESLLRAGMLGQGKVSAGLRPLMVVLLRRPLRWIWLRVWPLLP